MRISAICLTSVDSSPRRYARTCVLHLCLSAVGLFPGFSVDEFGQRMRVGVDCLLEQSVEEQASLRRLRRPTGRRSSSGSVSTPRLPLVG